MERLYFKHIKFGNKSIKITKQINTYLCLYTKEEKNLFNGPQSRVLESKWYTTQKNALQWANDKIKQMKVIQ